MNSNFKACSKCKCEKPATNDFFGSTKRTKSGLRSVCKECRKIESSAYYEENKEKVKEYYSDNRVKANEAQARYHEKRMQNPVKRAAYFARLFTTMALKRKGYSKTTSTMAILGCDFETFKAHIESNFKEGMSWENRSEWHIDHHVPLSSAKTKEDVMKLGHYTNLNPLWSIDNLKKGSKIVEN